MPCLDSGIVGVSLDTTIAGSTSAYLRYDGKSAGTGSAHTFSIGMRVRW